MMLTDSLPFLITFIYILVVSFRIYRKEWLNPSRIHIGLLEKLVAKNPEFAVKFDEIDMRYSIYQSILTSIGGTLIIKILFL